MNRYLTGIIALVLVSAGGIYLLAVHTPGDKNPAATPQRQLEKSPIIAAPVAVVVQDAPAVVSAPTNQDAMLQAPDESKPLPLAAPNQVPVQVASMAGHKSPYAQITIPVGQPVPELFPYQTERDEISQLASTYDAKKIPAIASFLSHKDASVREAARQGLIQLGEKKAVPVLEAAAEKAPTPEEAALLTQAAEFLALPSFVDVIFPKQSAPKS